MIVVSRYTVGFINHPRTVSGSPERLPSAAPHAGVSMMTDVARSRLQGFVRHSC